MTGKIRSMLLFIKFAMDSGVLEFEIGFLMQCYEHPKILRRFKRRIFSFHQTLVSDNHSETRVWKLDSIARLAVCHLDKSLSGCMLSSFTQPEISLLHSPFFCGWEIIK